MAARARSSRCGWAGPRGGCGGRAGLGAPATAASAWQAGLPTGHPAMLFWPGYAMPAPCPAPSAPCPFLCTRSWPTLASLRTPTRTARPPAAWAPPPTWLPRSSATCRAKSTTARCARGEGRVPARLGGRKRCQPSCGTEGRKPGHSMLVRQLCFILCAGALLGHPP